MAKRTKKPPVKPEKRRDWLKRFEEDGESPPQIAKRDGFDIRTVRAQLDVAKQEREAREARIMVVRNAMEKHYGDLRKYAEKLNSEISGIGTVAFSPDDEFIERALRQHLPRSPIWSYLSKRRNLLSQVDEGQARLETKVKELVGKNKKLVQLNTRLLDQVLSGMTDILIAEAKQWLNGNTGYSLKNSTKMEPAEKGLVLPRIGFAVIGHPVKESDIKEDFQNALKELEISESKLKESQEYLILEKTSTEIKKTNEKLRQELALIRLRRIVPGHCELCPL